MWRALGRPRCSSSASPGGPRPRSRRDPARPRRAAARGASAAAGSFSPWPVTVTTMRSPSTSPRRTTARPAAEDGSQKSPSSSASLRQAPTSSSSSTATNGGVGSAHGLRVHRIADPDRRGERRLPVDGLDRDERRLEPELPERLRVGRRVPAASVREHEAVRRAAELLDDLEHGGLLALAAIGVERVDEDVRPRDRRAPAPPRAPRRSRRGPRARSRPACASGPASRRRRRPPASGRARAGRRAPRRRPRWQPCSRSRRRAPLRRRPRAPSRRRGSCRGPCTTPSGWRPPT